MPPYLWSFYTYSFVIIKAPEFYLEKYAIQLTNLILIVYVCPWVNEYMCMVAEITLGAVPHLFEIVSHWVQNL